MYFDFTTTPVYDQPALRYPSLGPYGELDIPLHLKDYKGPTREVKVNVVTYLPFFDLPSNTAQGGSALSAGNISLGRIVLQGYMDTPVGSTYNTGSFSLATPLLEREGYTITFADYIAMQVEGRGNPSATVRSTINPLWFRDGFGRVFSNPRVVDFSAGYVEGRPGRTTFNMTLFI